MKRRAWSVVLAAAGINLINGFLYIWSIISRQLMADYGWTSAQASLPYTLNTVAFVISMLFFGSVQDRRGPRLCGMLAAVIMGVGLILSAFVTSPILMALTFGVVAGGGTGITNACTSAPALKWFPKERKGLVTGVVMAGVALSSILYSPLASYLIARSGIAATFLWIGAANLILVFLLSLVLKNPPESYDPYACFAVMRRADTIVSGPETTRRDMLKSGRFYLLWIIFALAASAGLMVIGHAAGIAQVQADWNGGMVLVMLMAVFNAGGRLVAGVLSDRIGRLNTLFVLCALQAVNMFLFRFYTTPALLIAGIAVAGVCYGGPFSVFPALTSDCFGLKNYGANYGALFTAWGMGGIIGPMVAASVFDASGSYRTAFLIAFILLVIAAAMTVITKKRFERE